MRNLKRQFKPFYLTVILFLTTGCQNICFSMMQTPIPQDGRNLTPEELASLEASFEAYKMSDEYKQIQKRNFQIAHMRSAFSSPSFSHLLRQMIENEELFELLEWTPQQRGTVKPILEEIARLEAAQHDMADAEFNSKRFALIDELIETNMDFQSLEIVGARLNGDILNIVQNSDLMARYLEITKEQREKILEKSTKIGLELRQAIQSARRKTAQLLSKELSEEQKKKMAAVYGGSELDESLGKSGVRALTYFLVRGSRDEQKLKRDLRPEEFTFETLNTFGQYSEK